MYTSIIVLAAAFGSVIATPSPQATGTGLALGAQCDPSIPNVCANGVNCYATNSMLIPACGNFQASCTSDSQCAFNTCNAGLCNGFKPTTTPYTPPIPKPTGTNLPLGATCDPAVKNQCANGVDCYSTNSGLIPACGNFQASCTSDAQCAFNTCRSGFCNGPKPSSTPSTPGTPKPTGTNLPLGEACDPSVENQCANGADCYATNSMLIPRCGNFQSSCTSDAQCAFNKCNNGFCNGPPLSTSTTSNSATTSVTGSGYTNSSATSALITSPSTTPAIPTVTSTSSVRYSNTTTTTSPEAPIGYTTSIVIVNGQTSSVLINGAGATTSFGASPTGALQSNGAAKLMGGLGGLFVVAFGTVMVL